MHLVRFRACFVTFPCSDCLSCNSHYFCKLLKCEPFLIPLDLDEVPKRLDTHWQWLTTNAVYWYMGTRHRHLTLCNIQ